MNQPRRAAFTPLHLPHVGARPIVSRAPGCRTLKRHECRAPKRREADNPVCPPAEEADRIVCSTEEIKIVEDAAS